MKLLLDTPAALWWLGDDERLSAPAREHLRSADVVLLSAVTVWEVAIKRGLGKLRAPGSIAAALVPAAATGLPVTLAHAATVETLPPHHRDPFDRLLIAQALAEGATVLTRDPAFAPYGVATAW